MRAQYCTFLWPVHIVALPPVCTGPTTYDLPVKMFLFMFSTLRRTSSLTLKSRSISGDSPDFPFFCHNLFYVILWIAFQGGTFNSTVNTLTDDKIFPAGLCPQRRITNNPWKGTMYLCEAVTPRCCCCCLSLGRRAKPPDYTSIS